MNEATVEPELILTANSTQPDVRDERLAVVEIVTLGVIFTLTLAGNGFILHAILQKRVVKPPSRVYMLMFHLSFADFLVGLFNIFPQLLWDIAFRFKGNNALCKFVKYMQVFVLYLSSYVLVAMAIDRWMAIRMSPCMLSPIKMIRVLITAAWLISATLSLPQLFIFSYMEVKPDVWDCWGTYWEPHGVKVYVVWFVLSAFVFPMIIISLCYGYICCKIWAFQPASTLTARNGKISTQVEPLGTSSLSDTISSAKIKTVKMTLTVVLCFVICWLPFSIAQLFVTFTGSTGDVGPVFTIFMLLPNLNSCTNPWIYMAFSGTLLNRFRLLCGFGLSRFEDSDSVGDMEPTPKRIYRPTKPQIIVQKDTQESIIETPRNVICLNTFHLNGASASKEL